MSELEISTSECVDTIMETFKGDYDLLIKMYLAIKKINPERIKYLEYEVFKERPEYIHDVLVQIIHIYIYDIIYNDLRINNISIYELESHEYSIEIKKLSEEIK